MADSIDFTLAFRALTDHDPFPWQESLYEQFASGCVPPSCDIPTGLGKTAVIPIWLIALVSGSCEDGAPAMPRRLVYVVNRRTVVDQSTSVVEKMRERLLAPDRAEWAQHKNVLRELRDRLQGLAATDDLPLAVSTLRGQLADNGEWRSDPARPAVILGTVDMIGSRLLFSGYGCGYRTKPLHAGFLGQDTLVVHDEAHLEPAFQDLLNAIREEQKKGRTPDCWPLQIMELTATSRGQGERSGLTNEEKNPPDVLPDPPEKPLHFVWRRLKAKKALRLHENKDRNKLAEEIAALALEHKGSDRAVLVFARKIVDVGKIVKKLPKDSTERLTGTLRGRERDALVKKPVFQRFLPESSRDPAAETAKGTVYLVCTSAGEVGIDISADHMVCDLTTFESMAQRFGRVNRFGDRDDTRIDVVHPAEFDDKKKADGYETRCRKTLDLLKQLDGDASPSSLGKLDAEECRAAFAPEPTILCATDILFDAWALTTIRDKLPGRPPVEPYLHGISEWEPPETHVAWREEVGRISEDLLERYSPDDLLENYRLKPHELLRDISARVFDQLAALVKEPKPNAKLKHDERRQIMERATRNSHAPVWLLRSGQPVRVTTLGKLVKEGKEAIFHATLLLPPTVGGLQDGMLNGGSPTANDVADEWHVDGEHKVRRRIRVWDDDDQFEQKTRGMRLIQCIDFPSVEGDEDAPGPSWHWYTRPRSADDDGSRAATKPIKWQDHTDDVTRNAERIVEALNLSRELKDAVVLAARFHDLGKRRELWQRSIGNPLPPNPEPDDWLAKSGRTRKRTLHNICPNYRHEFGSLLDVLDRNDESREYFAKLTELSNEMQDLVLHLIAAGHGRARPHFPSDELLDLQHPDQDAAALAVEIPRRYARLQRRYGRWGLAYLESLLRAADYAASANPSEHAEDQS